MMKRPNFELDALANHFAVDSSHRGRCFYQINKYITKLEEQVQELKHELDSTKADGQALRFDYDDLKEQLTESKEKHAHDCDVLNNMIDDLQKQLTEAQEQLAERKVKPYHDFDQYYTDD